MHRKRRKSRRKKLWQFTKNGFWVSMGMGLLAVSFGLFWISNLTLPNLDTFDERKVVRSTKIYDRTGEILLFDFHKDITRTVIPAERISTYAKQATVAIEDNNFYQHKGIQPKAILRALVSNIKSGDILGGQGGSTVTQQVIKNALLTREKRISRKMKEWVLSLRLEQEYSKDEILALYLNEIPYGGTLYGIEEASQSFFAKSASEISLAEAAYLAALPQAPTFFSPFGNNKDKLDHRKNTVLNNMFNLGFITEEQRDEAKEELVEFLPPRYSQNSALHFVQYVREYLENKYGSEAVLNEGLRVITTLDFELQKKAEEMVAINALENEEKYDASNQGLIAIEAETGQIITMVGSRDYQDGLIDGNFNVTLAKRQPGSSFKPFAYVNAFEKGYTDKTIIFDTKTQFSTFSGCEPDNMTSEDNCYSPSNYDGKEKGPLSLRNALAQSRNIPAVKLLYLNGIKNALNTAKLAGINSLSNDPNQYGLTLVLGGGEVSLFDMTSAYTTFANRGTRVKPQAIIKVEDHVGNVLEKFSPVRQEVIKPEAVDTLNDILSDNVARAPLFGSRSFMYFGDGVDIAAKTGTTNDNKDAWLIGYSTEIAVGVWSGNNDNSPMQKGSSISGKTWREFFLEANKKYPPRRFASKPQNQSSKPILKGEWLGGETFTIDIISGKLATEHTPEEARFDIVIKNPHSILHWVEPNDPLGPNPSNPESNPQYIRWEYGVQKWLTENMPDLLKNQTIVPTEYDDIHTGNTVIAINTEKLKNISLKANSPIMIEPSITSTHAVSKVDFYLNGRFIGKVTSAPFSLSYIPSESDLKTNNSLRIVVTDKVLNKEEITVILQHL